MKTYLFSLLLLVSGCIQVATPPTDFAYVLIDRTDSMTCNANALPDQVFNSLSISTNMYAGATVIFAPISHYKINEHIKVSIPATDMIHINEPQRLAEIKRFRIELIAAIRSLTKTIEPQKESEVFYALFTAIRTTSKQDATHRSITVFSDMREHSDFFDAYDQRMLDSIKTNPGTLAEKVEAVYILPDTIQPMSITLRHCARSTQDDEAFYTIASWLRNYLGAKKIEVGIGDRE